MSVFKIRPPRCAIFISEEAAAAIRKATGNNGGLSMVRIMDVRAKTKTNGKFGENDSLDFRLKLLPGATFKKDDRRFGNDSVFVCVNEKYLRFMVGGRVLYHEERSDGSGFILWPLEWYRSYRRFVHDDEPSDGAGL